MGKPLELDRQQQPTAASQRLHAVAAPGGEQQQRQLQPGNSRPQANSASLRTAAAASGCINTADCTAPADRCRTAPAASSSSTAGCERAATSYMQEQRRAEEAAEATGCSRQAACNSSKPHAEATSAASGSGSNRVQTAAADYCSSSRQQAGTATGCNVSMQRQRRLQAAAATATSRWIVTWMCENQLGHGKTTKLGEQQQADCSESGYTQ